MKSNIFILQISRCIFFLTLLSVKAAVVERDVWGVAAADILLHRPYHLAEPPVTTYVQKFS
jgi:hypothetical protein